MSLQKSGASPLLDHLDEIEAQCHKGHITLKEIFDIFGTDGHSVLIFFLILPFLQPIPLFGLSTPFGLLIATVSGFHYLKKPPWLPKRWMNRELSTPTVLKISEGAEKIFRRISGFIHPRWNFLFKEPFRAISAVLVIANAILLALPLPIPFSNAIPAWMIFFYVLGELEADGLFVLLAYLQSLVCIIYFSALAFGLERVIFPHFSLL